MRFQSQKKKFAKSEKQKRNDPIANNMDENVNKIREIFEYPINQDLIFRDVYINSLKKKGVLFFLNGTIDKKQIEQHILAPLQSYCTIQADETRLEEAISQIANVIKVKAVTTFSELTMDMVMGNTILLIEGQSKAFSLGTTSFDARSIESTKIENVIKGPKEAFVESLDKNRSLIRKYVKNEKLVTENISVGERSVFSVSVMYIKDLANPDLVERVKKRIAEIQADSLLNLAILEQHLEERPHSLVPTVLYTERPDRAAAFLNEGFVVILDMSPSCLVVPVTMWSFFHTAEDQYQRWAYANFIRIIRFLSYMIALFTPGLFIGMTTYHIEMIPTDLLLSIAAVRELVPFPIFVEVLIMEVAFELIREAGTRVPTPLGPTISIVGALILGQAAVQAGIISPILVIVVAITGLASYAIPEVSSNYMVRIGRFAYLAIASFMGFFGISLFFTVSVAYMVSVKSFGVPFLSPKAPYSPSSKDTLFRPVSWKQWIRPTFIKPQDPIAAKPVKGGKEQ